MGFSILSAPAFSLLIVCHINYILHLITLFQKAKQMTHMDWFLELTFQPTILCVSFKLLVSLGDAVAHVWKLEHILQDNSLCFYTVGPKDQTKKNQAWKLVRSLHDAYLSFLSIIFCFLKDTCWVSQGVPNLSLLSSGTKGRKYWNFIIVLFKDNFKYFFKTIFIDYFIYLHVKCYPISLFPLWKPPISSPSH